MKTQLVYKVVKKCGRHYVSARTNNSLYTLVYKLNEISRPKVGYICTFNTLQDAQQFQSPSEVILFGIGYNPVKLKYLCDWRPSIPAFWKAYFSKKSTRNYHMNALIGTVGVTAFKPLEIVE